MTLFHMFWPLSMLRSIVEETKCYAVEVDENGSFCWGANWKVVTVLELKAFLIVIMYMGIKWQRNIRS